jgi:hypothetical protein
MIKTIADKLLASVVEIEDIDRAFPGIASFKGRIALDVHIEQGTLSVGKRVQLSGPQFAESVEIVGIETVLKIEDPNVVRILCSRPSTLTVPAGKIEGWNIAEQ